MLAREGKSLTGFLILRAVSRHGVALFAACMLLAAPATGADDFQRLVFEEGSRLRGKAYPLARDRLVAQGWEILPLLDERLTAGDWRERWFAAIVKFRIEHPGYVEDWRRKNLYAAPCGNRERDEDHYGFYGDAPAFYRFPYDTGAERRETLGGDPPSEEHAIYVDLLWEYSIDDKSSWDTRSELCHVGRVFALRPSVEMVEPLLEAIGGYSAAYGSLRGYVHMGLIRLGAPVVPRLRESLANAASYKGKLRALPLVLALSRMNDRSSIPLISSQLVANLGSHSNVPYLDALSFMKAAEGIEPTVDMILYLVRVPWPAEYYRHLKQYLLRYGEQAVPHVKERLGRTKDVVEQAVLKTLLVQLSGAEGTEGEAASLRENSLLYHACNPKIHSLRKLRQLTGEDIWPMMERRLYRQFNSSDLCLPGYREWFDGLAWLGELKEGRATTFLIGLFHERHGRLSRLLKQKKEQGGAGTFDFQALREAAFTFGSFNKQAAEPLAVGDGILRALRRIGGETARKTVASALAWPEFEKRARISLSVMDGDREALAALLRSSDREEREEAALALADFGDSRGLAELLAAAVRRRGPAHELWLAEALAFSAEVVPLLEGMAKSESVRERVLAEATLLARREPERTAHWKELARRLADRVTGQGGLKPLGLEMAGVGIVPATYAGIAPGAGKDAMGIALLDKLVLLDEKIARRFYLPYLEEITREENRIDVSLLPLVESTALYGEGIGQRGLAAFALRAFALRRSLPVLVEALDMGEYGGVNPAAQALTVYGQESADLLAKLPAPASGQFDVELRMTGMRGGIYAEADTSQIRSAEQIAQGLETLYQDRSIGDWEHRLGVYLGLAEKVHDARLVKPLVAFLVDAKSDEYRQARIVRLLGEYDDPALAPLLLERLAVQLPMEGFPLHKAATAAIARRRGNAAAAYLVEEFRSAQGEPLRAGILLALGLLSSPPKQDPFKYRDAQGRIDDAQTRASAAVSFEAPRSMLLEALSDPSFNVSGAAARALLMARQDESSSDLVGPLSEWLARHRRCVLGLVEYLGRHGTVQTGTLLLSLPRDSANSFDLIRALGNLRPEGAVPYLEQLALGSGEEPIHVEVAVKALAGFRESGGEALLRILDQASRWRIKADAASSLASMPIRRADGSWGRYTPAVPAITAQLRRLLQEDPSHPVIPDYVGTCAGVLSALAQLDRDKAREISKEILRNGPRVLVDVAMKYALD